MPLFTNRWKSFATPPTFADAIQANALGDDSQFEFADQSPTAGKMQPPEPIIPSQRQDSMDAMRKLPASKPPIASPNLPDVPEIQERDINRNMGRSPVDQSIMEVGESDLPDTKLPPLPNAISQYQAELRNRKMPEHQKPGLWRTLAAAGLGAAAGWNNADWRRNRPIDVSGITAELMHPEAGAMRKYERDQADTLEKLKAEQQAENIQSQIQGRVDTATAREDQNKMRLAVARENAETRREGMRSSDARIKSEQEARAIQNELDSIQSVTEKGGFSLPKGTPLSPEQQKRLAAGLLARVPVAGLTGRDVYYDHEAAKMAGKTPKEYPEAIQLGLIRLGYAPNVPLSSLPKEDATKLQQFSKADAATFQTIVNQPKADAQQRREIHKTFQPALDSGERFNVMAQSYEDAAKGDQQAMLSLLANHLGMTMGLQKGARLTKDIINEAIISRPWLQSLKAKFDDRGYLSGVVLSPEQMRQMVKLGQDRFMEDVRKARNEAKYLGADDDGPKREPNKSTIRYYMAMANGDMARAKTLAAADGWSIQ